MKGNASSGWWVVTDLDGTLLDHAYDWSAAAAVLKRLQQQGIPVIPCTSKTAEEVCEFRRQAGLRDPYIVENGGAVHGETSHNSSSEGEQHYLSSSTKTKSYSSPTQRLSD